MEPQTRQISDWRVEFLTLVRNEIRERVTSNTGKPDFILMWAKKPHDFVEAETRKLLEDASSLLLEWTSLESTTSGKAPLAQRWSGLAQSQKMHLAKLFTDFFYKKRDLVT